MKISTLFSYSGGLMEAVEEVQALEKSGFDTVFVPKAYGFDAPSFMAFIAARTERVRIASGILPVFTRTPTLLAMTAAGVDMLSNGRSVLGFGPSGHRRLARRRLRCARNAPSRDDRNLSPRLEA